MRLYFGIVQNSLAYTVFEVINTHNIAYNYIVHRGEQVPMIKLIISKQRMSVMVLHILPVNQYEQSHQSAKPIKIFDNITYKGMNIITTIKYIKVNIYCTSREKTVLYKLSICLGGKLSLTQIS